MTDPLDTRPNSWLDRSLQLAASYLAECIGAASIAAAFACVFWSVR